MWLWPATAAPIGPLAWEPPYVAGEALEKTKKKFFFLISLSRIPVVAHWVKNSPSVYEDAGLGWRG